VATTATLGRLDSCLLTGVMPKQGVWSARRRLSPTSADSAARTSQLQGGHPVHMTSDVRAGIFGH